MTLKNNLLSKINAMWQLKWMRSALMTLALLVAVLGVTGCGGSNDSGNHGNHMNHGK